jgi:hypothetical protein
VAAHALAEAAVVQRAAAHLAQRVLDLAPALGEGLAHAGLEHRRHLGRQAHERGEGRAGARRACAFEQLGHVGVVQTGISGAATRRRMPARASAASVSKRRAGLGAPGSGRAPCLVEEQDRDRRAPHVTRGRRPVAAHQRSS